MCYWVLPISGIPIARTTIQALNESELESEIFKVELKRFEERIREKFKEQDLIEDVDQSKLYREDEDQSVPDEEHQPIDSEAVSIDVDVIEQDSFDELLLTEPVMYRDGQQVRAKIIGRKRNADGDLIGNYNPNPVLNTRIYLAELPDGYIQELSVSTVIEAIYNQIDENGNDQYLFQDIVEHRRTHDASVLNETHDSQDNHPKCTTAGWEICIAWQDGTTSWHPLSDVKNSFQVQLARYAKANKLEREPAFSWWVNQTLKKEMRLIKSMKMRYSKQSHKFGIYVPTSVEEALNIDKETNTTYWRDAIHKEMTNNRKAFKFLEDGELIPIGYQWIHCHMIFDAKMDFTRKARFVAGGHMTDPPSTLTYSSVVSRDSVRIAFLLAALNGVSILATDVGNAYLNAEPREKVYTTAGPEFGGELQGKSVLIVRALYGLKSSGAAWRAHLANTLHQLGYNSCLAYPDVWFRPAKKQDGFKYYEYVLVYVDDLLVLSHQGEKTMKALQDFHRLKDGYGPPYLIPGCRSQTMGVSSGCNKNEMGIIFGAVC